MTESRPPILTRLQLGLLGAWILVTAPFTRLGYGSDSDAWLVYDAARQIWQSGAYVRSRSTGFPVYELLVTPLVHVGSWYLANLLSLAAGALFLLALFRLWNRGHLRHPLLVVLCTGFLPVFVKNGSSTMDYVCGAAALAWSYALLVEGRLGWAAGLVGLAAGCRPSNGILVLPSALFARMRGRSLAAVALLVLGAVLAGAVAFSPALLRYGLRNTLDAQRLVESLPWVTRLLVVAYNGSQLYGVLGTLGILLFAGYAAVRRGKGALDDGPVLAYHLLNLALFAVIYVRVPYEAEYLFPIVFSVALLMDRLLDRRAFAVLAVVLLSYHVVQVDVRGGTSGARQLRPRLAAGFTVRDVQDRVFKLSLRRAAENCRLDRPTVLMYGFNWIPDPSGRWEFDPALELWRQKDGNLCVSRAILDLDHLRDLNARGFRVVIWRSSVSDYLSGRGEERRPYVEVIDRLEDLVGSPLEGRASSD